MSTGGVYRPLLLFLVLRETRVHPTSSSALGLLGGPRLAVVAAGINLKHETSVWFEITNLVIPGLNDTDKTAAMWRQPFVSE